MNLLPCPFCGSEPRLHEATPAATIATVECPTQYCPLSFVWPPVEAWNKRARSENRAQSVPAGMWHFTYYSEDFDAVQRVRVQGVSAFGKRPDGVTGIVKKEGKNADER